MNKTTSDDAISGMILMRRILTLTIPNSVDGRIIAKKLQDFYRKFDEVIEVAQTDSVIYRWYQVDQLYARRILQMIFQSETIRSYTLSQANTARG